MFKNWLISVTGFLIWSSLLYQFQPWIIDYRTDMLAVIFTLTVIHSTLGRPELHFASIVIFIRSLFMILFSTIMAMLFYSCVCLVYTDTVYTIRENFLVIAPSYYFFMSYPLTMTVILVIMTYNHNHIASTSEAKINQMV